ncbi:superoxide dismutase [Tieghemostelium lacteum]|uniref:Superoxide dismutase n=1 Tax=Tieghemostelium lacteum TaxID=361077 RepID=A0A151ZGJ2_TIELA|nr:superoxide dismutase [Tieghemostelium lacteum]|eukprot:KYQ93029.1 superoxide dismutase [Tieghemostelium lacteum]
MRKHLLSIFILFTLLSTVYGANEFAVCTVRGIGSTTYSQLHGEIFLGYDGNGNLFVDAQLVGTMFTANALVVHNTGDYSDTTFSSSSIFNPNGNVFGCDVIGVLGDVEPTATTLTASNRKIEGTTSMIGMTLAVYQNALGCSTGSVGYATMGPIIGKCIIGIGNTNASLTPRPVTFTPNITNGGVNGASYGNADSDTAQSAYVRMFPTSKFPNTVTPFTGSIFFELLDKVTGDIRITASFVALNIGVNATHGFHIHTFGDQINVNGLSLGPHWQSKTPVQTHNLPAVTGRHWGDLGNLCIYDSFNVTYYKYTTTYIPYTNLNNIIGRGIAIHAKADNGTDTSFGDRIAYGTIGMIVNGQDPDVPISIPNSIDFPIEPTCEDLPIQTTTTSTTTDSSTTGEPSFAIKLKSTFFVLVSIVISIAIIQF